VLQGYASTYRLPREDFFRACGRNLWRFIRLMIVAGIGIGAVVGTLFGLHGVLERQAAESTNELLLPEVRFAGLAVILLVMTALRIGFDLAEPISCSAINRPCENRSPQASVTCGGNLGRLLGITSSLRLWRRLSCCWPVGVDEVCSARQRGRGHGG